MRVFALAEEMGSVRAACRAMGIHPSTSYRLRKLVRRGGLKMLRPRERRIAQMPNHTPMFVEERVLAYATHSMLIVGRGGKNDSYGSVLAA